MASGLAYRLLILLLKSGSASKWCNNTRVFRVDYILTPLGSPTSNGRMAIFAPFFSELFSLYDVNTAELEADYFPPTHRYYKEICNGLFS